jgi:uncharacterized RDD family membrane protein YckC
MVVARTARVWKRMLAFLLDLYLSLVVCIGLVLVIVGEIPFSFTMDSHLSPVALAALTYMSIFVLLYHVFCEYILGQTPGMLLFGLTAQRTNAKKPMGFWESLGRNLFILPFFPFTLLWIVEPVYYMFQGERLLERSP